MENLPAPTPSRQWFRLASLARMEALGQSPDQHLLTSTSAAPAQGPTPAALRPPSPAPLPAPINPRLQPSEPPQSQPSPTKSASNLQSTTATVVAPVARTPPLPLPTIRVPPRSLTPPQSPKIINASAPNPSESLRVPKQLQPHPEPEPKPKMPPPSKQSSNSIHGKKQEYSSQSSSAKEQTATSSNRKNNTENNNENQMKMITMAGDNTGAYFELLPARRGNNSAKKGEEHKGKVNGELNHDGVQKEEAKPKRSVVNSNVQSVNNSILFGTSCTLQSPGVHVTFVSRRQPKHKGGSE